MTKLLSYILLGSLLLMLAGCGGEQVPEPPLQFSFENTVITMDAPAAPILEALGEPLSYTEETSCAFDGLDKTYYYGSFYLTTCPGDGGDRIRTLWFADDTVKTPEGITVGSSREEAEKAFGIDAFDGTAFVLRRGNTALTAAIKDGTVRSVRYDLVIE